ncbi:MULTISPECIES: bifunctional oligoribonuclease/PAP phosphatase NrnA [unclassified Halanaerobium]|uniref:DHH family phosphoesterase n=1 Tax=unclassified Halanaerobium TaxID=2641197 RepID=UPI000DF152A1|nr:MULTISPECIES: DHH family phosphoesterase [unclassified Halanaerobium]RCW51563.1 phosphoesterase RecJ-like protein [Halanaerobium sp. MA284_MarDTE_T2]RCW89351.1 phosphoesterase RecJ-like protein [Halanaerobium sp. DL-01]
MKDNLKKIAEKLHDNQNFIITGHIDPDGDSVGSVLALTRILKKQNKNVRAYLDDRSLASFSFLKAEKDEIFDDDFLNTNNLVVIALDSGTLDRAALKEQIFKTAKLTINLDHHADNTHFADINLVNSDKAAVGEIIYDLAKFINADLKDEKIGDALAVAIISDTGALRYENTSSDVLRILAELMDNGVDIYRINKELFGSYSYESLLLKGLALSTLTLTKNGKIAWLYVDQSMISEAGSDYTEGLVNYARDIKGVEIGIFFSEEKPKSTRVSFRSNYYAEVNKLAAEFNGGGHARAAGAEINRPLEIAIYEVIKAAGKYV